MTDAEFHGQVLGALGRIEERVKNTCDDLSALKLTLFGSEGRTGLVEEVHTLRHRQGLWNKLIALAVGLLTVLASWMRWGSGGNP